MDGKGIKNKGKIATIFVARVAICAALLTVGKMAFAAIPNVEVVTVLIIVYGATLGLPYALTATLIFCTMEMAIWPPHTWVVMYYIHWPTLAIVSSLVLRRRNVLPTVVFAVVVAVVSSELLGVLSASVDTLFCVGNLTPAGLRDYWIAYYLRGVYFDVVHMISNGIIVAVLFAPLVLLVRSIAPDACAILPRKFKKISRMAEPYAREIKDGEEVFEDETFIVEAPKNFDKTTSQDD